MVTPGHGGVPVPEAVEVELVEVGRADPDEPAARVAPVARGDDPDDADDRAPARRRRRTWLAAGLTAAAVLAGLGAGQALLDAGARARAARYAAVPGTVLPVQVSAGPAWTVAGAAVDALTGAAVVGDLAVGIDRRGTGHADALAVDLAAGAVRWRVALDGAPELPGSTSCDAVAGPDGTPLVACTLTGRAGRDDSRVYLLDPADGSEVATRGAPPGATTCAVHGLLLLAWSDGATRLAVRDPSTGATVTRLALDSAVAPSDPWTQCTPAGDQVWVSSSVGSWLVGVAPGGALRDPVPATGWVTAARDGAAAVTDRTVDGTELVTFVDAGGTGPRVTGRSVRLGTDDGSASGLQLVAAPRRVSAVGDAGDTVWSLATTSTAGPGAVWQDRLYLADGAALVAVELRTGRELWRWEPPTPRTAGGEVMLRTDGTLLYRLDGWWSDPTVSAFALGDGTLVWRLHDPETLGAVRLVGQRLVGLDAAGDRAFPLHGPG